MKFSLGSIGLWLGIAVVVIAAILGFALKDKLFGWMPGPGKVIETHTVVLEKIELLGKMELVKYQFADALEYVEDKAWMPHPKVIMIAAGEAVGCVDFSRVDSNSIQTFGDSIIVVLPAPELCYYKLDQQKTRVVSTSFTTLYGSAQITAEAFKKAEDKIRESALNSGILHDTQVQADHMLKPMLEALSGKKVRLVFSSNVPSVVRPG
ncbi:MAG: DUF4230 domain-containing protein [Bacteroidia bacterium]|nr:DUF4230 domain-containing protein [Bacteroidia bacterium]